MPKWPILGVIHNTKAIFLQNFDVFLKKKSFGKISALRNSLQFSVVFWTKQSLIMPLVDILQEFEGLFWCARVQTYFIIGRNFELSRDFGESITPGKKTSDIAC